MFARKARDEWLRGKLAVPLGVLLEDLDLLELLEDGTGNSAGGPAVVAGAGAVVLPAAVQLPQLADAETTTKVDLTGDRG